MSLTEGILLRKNKDGIEWNADEIRKTITLTPLERNNIERKIPIADGCFYHDNFWDFNKFNKLNKPKEHYQINFDGIKDSYMIYAKDFALRQLSLKRNKVVTVGIKVGIIRSFINWLDEQKISHVETLTPSSLAKYFESMDITEHRIDFKKTSIKEFLQVIQKYLKCNFNSVYELLSERKKDKEKQQRENGKHKLIPYQSTMDSTSCFDTIVSLAIKDLTNESLSIKDRMTACMVVILAETGMRIGEFRILEVDKLEPIKHPTKKDMGSQYILKFITYKTTVENDGKPTQTFMTPNAVLAYNTLYQLTKERRKKSKAPQYLFLNSLSALYSNDGSIWDLNRDFYYRHQSELKFDNMNEEDRNQFHVWFPTENDIRSKSAKPQDLGKTFYYVTPHQYRVTCATILYVRERKSLEWIRRHMNHLAIEMTQHYIREEAKKKHRIGIAKAIITRSNSEGTKLETDINKISDPEIKQELKDEKYIKAYDEINRFLGKLSTGRKKLNIKKNINEIIESLYRTQMPITELELGFCALDTLELMCERQAQLNRLEDFNIQIPTIDTLHISYKRFQDKIQVIDYNYKLSKDNEAYKDNYEKELNSFKTFMEKRFLPELQLLDSGIEQIGIGAVTEKYPNIKYIIDNLTDIKKEVIAWNQKVA